MDPGYGLLCRVPAFSLTVDCARGLCFRVSRSRWGKVGPDRKERALHRSQYCESVNKMGGVLLRMVRSEPVLLGIFAIGVLYLFPIPSVNLTIPEILRVCSLQSPLLLVQGNHSDPCGFWLWVFYIIWGVAIAFIFGGIMAKEGEKQVEPGGSADTRAPPIKPVRSVPLPEIKNIPEKPVIRPFLKRMMTKVETVIFEKDGEEKRKI